jgi:hypothetical protein
MEVRMIACVGHCKGVRGRLGGGARLAQLLIALLTVVIGAAAPRPVLACACCSNEGQRYVETDRIDAYAKGLLDELRFAAAAHLYTGEADVESIKGITAKSTDFQLAVTKSEKSWLFEFKEDGGGGTLVLPLPDRMTRFEVDPRDPQSRSPGTGPALYKEWRLAATPQGTGMFAGATGGGQKATLVLHARGNSCTDASQFSGWSLILYGPKGTITFYGDLTDP